LIHWKGRCSQPQCLKHSIALEALEQLFSRDGASQLRKRAWLELQQLACASRATYGDTGREGGGEVAAVQCQKAGGEVGSIT
jgi:hypothetical protein